MEGTLLEQPDLADVAMEQALHALADPQRLRLVRLLSGGDTLSCGMVGLELDLHKSTMSHHWKVLREAGITTTTLKGRERFVRLRRPDFDERFPGLLDAVLAGPR